PGACQPAVQLWRDGADAPVLLRPGEGGAGPVEGALQAAGHGIRPAAGAAPQQLVVQYQARSGGHQGEGPGAHVDLGDAGLWFAEAVEGGVLVAVDGRQGNGGARQGAEGVADGPALGEHRPGNAE